MEHAEITSRLQAVTASLKALPAGTPQARLDELARELETLTTALTTTHPRPETARQEEMPLRTADLQTTQEQLQSILDSSLYVIQAFQAVRNTAGNIVDFVWMMNNRKAVEQNGDVIGKSLLKQNPGIVASSLFDKFIEVTETGTSIKHDQFYNYEQFNGWFRQTLVKMGDGFVMTTENITTSKNAEQEILQLKDELAQTAEEKYRSLFNSIDEGFCLIEILVDEHGKAIDYRFLEYNPAFERQTGIQNAIGRRVREFVPKHEEYWFEVYGEVARTGKPVRFENRAEQLHRYYDVYAFRVGQPSERQVAVLFTDISERKQLEQRQTYLLKLSDALRSLSDPIAIQQTACRILGEFTGVNRVFYGEVVAEKELIFNHNYVNGVEPIIARMTVDDFGSALRPAYKRGENIIINDITTDPRFTEKDRQNFMAVDVMANLSSGLIKHGQWVAVLVMHKTTPHQWTPLEITLMEETAERTWDAVERAHAEAAEHKQRLLADGLRDTAIALSDTLDINEVLERALSSARRLVAFDAAVMVLTDAGKLEHFQTKGVQTSEHSALEQWHHDQDNLHAAGLYQSTANRCEPVIIRSESPNRLHLPVPLGQSLLVLPLCHESKIIGYLTLINQQAATFSETDFPALQAFAYQVVTTIQSARRFQQAQELAVLQERQQIARELHDAVTQTLFTASIIVEKLVRHPDKHNLAEMERLLALVYRLVHGGMAEMRILMLELRPTHVSNTPFSQLLRHLGDAARTRKNVEINFTFEGETALPPEVHFALYRIAQEAMNNILKHANAKQIWITGHGGKNTIEFNVRDDGSGFDTRQSATGMGMQNMHERAAEIRAQLTLTSHIGDGTEIRVVWPAPA